MTFRAMLPALALLSACSVGVELHEFKPAQGPAGVHVTAYVVPGIADRNRLHGELLAADTERFVLLLDDPLPTSGQAVRLVELPRNLLRRIKLEQVGTFLVRPENEARDDDKLHRFQRLSRYPQGLDERIRTALLRELGQAEIYSPPAGA